MGLGTYTAQAGHWVPLINPIDITGGKNSPWINLAKYAHASILIQIGVSAAAPGLVTLNAASDSSGTGSTAIPFNVFKGETAATDVLGARVAVAAAGFTPSANDTIYYIIEIDAQSLPQGLNWLQLAMANATNSVIASAAAWLSGARQASDQSPTVLS
jgi:hypothetical protein